MRIRCNGFGWFDAAAGAIAGDHEVVRLSDEQLAWAWRAPHAEWWRAGTPAG